MQRKTIPSYITKRIASRLRGRFSEGGVTQMELAAATGILRTTVYARITRLAPRT